jgi:hypothetical protein
MIDLGIAKDLGTDDPKEDGWFGPFNATDDCEFVVAAFNKCLRMSKAERGGRGSQRVTVLVGLGGDTHWISFTAKKTIEMISHSQQPKKWRNALETTDWWFRVSQYSVSCWPRNNTNTEKNADNNWGEEE